jgi:2-polyprenyl-3-methyl-5-hydroxy-6-metoxy-1,4-benzoquinol methylase
MAETNRNLIWNQRPCPLCDSTKFSPKAEARAKFPAEESSWEQVKDAFVGIRNDQVFFSFYRCLDCQLLYCPWYFTNEQLDVLYSEMPDNTMGEDKRTASKTQSRYARNIVKISGRIKSFLEIGPDIGLVAKEVVTLANVQQVYMVEPNAAVHKELSQNLEKSKHQEICIDIEKLTANNFDLVVGIHVLDHLLHPKHDLASISKSSGDLQTSAFVVHNEKSILRRVLAEKWPPFCLQHPQLYNRKTLKRMLETSDFEDFKFSRTINYYHLNNLSSMLLKILGLPQLLNKVVPHIEMPFILGNFMVTARKK